MTYTDAVTVADLRVGRGGREVLRGVDLTVGRGIHALLGPNGAGKTTLVSVLATLLRPGGGSARVFGHDVVTESAAVRRRIGLTGQYPSVDEVLTGHENLAMTARLLGLDSTSARARATDLLERFDLADAGGRRVATWSGGMRRRLDLASTLVRPPALLILDEPTTGLDTTSRARLWDEVRELAASGTTVLLTTQYLEEADALAERVSVLHDGRIVAEGTSEELKARAGGAALEARSESGEVRLTAPTDGTVASAAATLSTWLTTEPQTGDLRISVRRPTLDEAFVALTSGRTGPGPGQAPAPGDPITRSTEEVAR